MFYVESCGLRPLYVSTSLQHRHSDSGTGGDETHRSVEDRAGRNGDEVEEKERQRER